MVDRCNAVLRISTSHPKLYNHIFLFIYLSRHLTYAQISKMLQGIGIEIWDDNKKSLVILAPQSTRGLI
jgi:hypothetical protein